MSRMHILEQYSPNFYRIICHDNMPAGTNSAGILWADAMMGSGRAATRMTIGTKPGQITQAEADQIAQGAVVEGEFYFQDDPTMTGAQRNSALDAFATRYLADLQAQIAASLKYFGLTR